MEAEGFARAEEVIRQLAVAAGAARLYPAASALPKEATGRFVEIANKMTASGPLRYQIEPHGIRMGTIALAPGQGQVTTLGEALYAMQVGQLVLANGLSDAEAEAFIALANATTGAVRAAGGPKAALASAGVQHIAVGEVNLKQTNDSELGVDLTTDPLSEISERLVEITEERAQTADSGPAGDLVADALAEMGDAARDLAYERTAQAMMMLDEQTRMRVLAMSLKTDSTGARMDGMLDVLAHMKPAALARLLKLTATQADTDPRRIAAAMPLPPDTMKALAMLLAPTPETPLPDLGVPDDETPRLLAEEVWQTDDIVDPAELVAIASPRDSAGRALATAISISRMRVDADTVQAIADVLPDAASQGSFATVREALRRLYEIECDQSLAAEVATARQSLADLHVLRKVCAAAHTDADAAIAGEMIQAAGSVGAEALLESYIRLPRAQRSLLLPVLRGSSEMVLGIARSRARISDSATAIGIVRTLADLGDSRAVAVISQVLDASLDERVRFAAATSLANTSTPEAEQALIKALAHREIETKRHVVRELGRIKSAAAVPSLARFFDDVSVLTQSYETRKDIIAALEAIGTPDAQKALRRFASRIPLLGRKSRDLKRLATDAASGFEATRGVDAP
ncbi:MAG TPA: HEAT repeat domain-containing protein [Coriobacteriia bacterium]|nr:HEAT repeat domain-containing protein [Coriobacteriia bacterium]